MRRATSIGPLIFSVQPHFYPRSPCGERLHLFASSGVDFAISIHALLAESDRYTFKKICNRFHFYPRSPCGERPFNFHLAPFCTDFYPRSPCGERPRLNIWVTLTGHFYPRSPCGERRKQGRHYIGCKIFLSTLSLRRATGEVGAVLVDHVKFLSTLSLRRATNKSTTLYIICIFLSTLSLRRATSARFGVVAQINYFYPRSPCGERLLNRRFRSVQHSFLSTLSLRRATAIDVFLAVWAVISIHALLAESDRRGAVSVILII